MYCFACVLASRVDKLRALCPCACAPQVVCEVGKAVGAEGLVAGQIVDIKSEGMAEQVCCRRWERRALLCATWSPDNSGMSCACAVCLPHEVSATCTAPIACGGFAGGHRHAAVHPRAQDGGAAGGQRGLRGHYGRGRGA